MIDDHMPNELKKSYFQAGYRFRIVKSVSSAHAKRSCTQATKLSPALGGHSSLL
jgi:hypothetical protein